MRSASDVLRHGWVNSASTADQGETALPRFKSSTGGGDYIPDVADFQEVVGTIKSIEYGDSDYDERGQLIIEFSMEDSKRTNLRAYFNFTTGQMPNGTVAKMRQLICAISNRPITDEPWIDDDTLEFGWGNPEDPNEVAAGRLTPGQRVQMRGQTVSKNTQAGEKKVWNIVAIEPVGGRRGQAVDGTPVPATTQPASPAQGRRRGRPPGSGRSQPAQLPAPNGVPNPTYEAPAPPPPVAAAPAPVQAPPPPPVPTPAPPAPASVEPDFADF